MVAAQGEVASGHATDALCRRWGFHGGCDHEARWLGFAHMPEQLAADLASKDLGEQRGQGVSELPLRVRDPPRALDVSDGSKSYRICRLKLLQPDEIAMIAVSAHLQPDHNQTNRGTVYSRCCGGDAAPVVSADMTVPLVVQPDPDQGAIIDELEVFGLAVTLALPGEVALYEIYADRAAFDAHLATRHFLEFDEVGLG